MAPPALTPDAQPARAGARWRARQTGPAVNAEDDATAPLLMAKSGHARLRTLGRYARPGTEALARWQQ